VELVPFTSARKSMATVIQKDSTYHCHVKGASEIILEQCTHYINSKGEIAEVTAQEKERVLAYIQTLAEGALRTISIAYRETTDSLIFIFCFILILI